MGKWNKPSSLILAMGFLLLATYNASPANAQQGGVSDSTEKVISMNGLSSDRSYIVYLSWQPNGTDTNIFDIFIDDAATSARLHDIKYDIALYSGSQLVPSSQRTDQISTRQFYDFKDTGLYTVRISNIGGSGEFINFPVQVTPEFQLHILLALSATFAGIVALQRFHKAA